MERREERGGDLLLTERVGTGEGREEKGRKARGNGEME